MCADTFTTPRIRPLQHDSSCVNRWKSQMCSPVCWAPVLGSARQYSAVLGSARQCSAVLSSALSFSLSPVKLARFKDHKHFSYCTNYLKKRAAQGGNMRQKCACIINTMLGNDDVTVHLLIWDNSAPASVGNSLRSAHEIFRAKQCS